MPNIKPFSRFSITFLALTIVFCLIQPSFSQSTKKCHYSCNYCLSQQYDHCIFCQDGFTLNAIKNKQKLSQQHFNRLEDHPWGTCMSLPSEANAFGIIVFLLVTISFSILRNKTIFYFLNTLQTFALFSLIEVACTEGVSYTLQGLEYFMLVSAADKSSKNHSLEVFEKGRYRMYEFLRSFNFQENMLPVFLFSLLAFIFAFLTPLCRYFARKQGSLWTICSCVNVIKTFTFIEIGSIILFFFLIQESILMIFIGIFLDSDFLDDGGNVVLVAVYVLMLGLMIVNICSKNMDIFGNKGAQQVEIIKKCIAPIFIVLPVNAHIILVVFMLIISITGLIFSRIKPVDKKFTGFHERLMKREFIYRIIEIAVIVLIGVYWLVENYVNEFKSSNAIGVIAIIVIVVYLICFFIQTGLQTYGKYIKKQDQRLYDILSTSMSSLRQSKMLEETIQNFETTEEGIMDMVFFGRNMNIDQKESPKKSNNIKLNLDIDNLNEEFEQNLNNQDKSSKSATNSPKHRDFKMKSARTPKYDRSSRLKLNKVLQTQKMTHQNQEIEQIEVQQVQMKKQNNNQQDENVQEVQGVSQNDISYEPRSQRTVHPITSRREEPIKTVREIRVDVPKDSHSPRFGSGEVVGRGSNCNNDLFIQSDSH